jgi:hypothetical protein
VDVADNDDFRWSTGAQTASLPIVRGTLGLTGEQIVFQPSARQAFGKQRYWSVPRSDVVRVYPVPRGSLPLAGIARTNRIAIEHSSGTTIFSVGNLDGALANLR